MSESPVDRLRVTEADTILDYRHFKWSSPQILSIGPSLLTGATLVLARRFSQARFFDWVRDYGVTVAVGIPTAINMLLARPVEVTGADVPRLRFMTSSTAPLSIDKHVEFERIYGIPIVQLAGGTETGFMCGNSPGERKLGSIGRPTLNMRVRILDETGREVAPGEEGEMVVSGRQMASAYWQGPGRLVSIPQDGFRNGDLARRDEDGFVDITGRKKDIVIKGGVNIASLEITNCLLEHPDVADAATSPRETTSTARCRSASLRPGPAGARPRPRSTRTVAPGSRRSRRPRPSSSSTPSRKNATARSTARRSPRSGSNNKAADSRRPLTGLSFGMQAVTVDLDQELGRVRRHRRRRARGLVRVEKVLRVLLVVGRDILALGQVRRHGQQAFWAGVRGRRQDRL